MDDFENFEFIDYTTSGPWERFITQIEESIRSWGLANRKLGVFDNCAIVTADKPVGSTSYSAEEILQNEHLVDNNTQEPVDNTQSSSQTYQCSEILSFDDATYSLSYHYNPARAKAAAGAERIDQEFLPNNLEGVHYHSLHRWTSLTHLLIISPVSIPDIFASTITSSVTSAFIDQSSAKLLLSSFAIAFQNTGCSIPVFVPTGQPWDLTFMGLMIQPQVHAPLSTSVLSKDSIWNTETDDDEFSHGIEVRFNTALLPYPPSQYTHLSGLLDYFVERMDFGDNDSSIIPSVPRDDSRKISDQIFASALFSYDLINWNDDDWKLRRQSESQRDVDQSPDEAGDPTFQMDVGATTAKSVVMNFDEIKANSRALSNLPVPVLPFGPVQDPLYSLRLLARFASAPSSIYIGGSDSIDMDAYNANILILQAFFREDDYGILSGMMEDSISSWNPEALENDLGGKSEKSQHYMSLLNRGAKLLQGNITMVDVIDVENIVEALFAPTHTSIPLAPQSRKYYRNIRTSDNMCIPASELGLRFRHAATFPCNSFLWRTIQYLLDVISPNSEISYATSVMGFMKVLWPELLKQFYSRWENSQLIPLVDIFGESDRCSIQNSACEPSNGQEKKPVAIDLRYNLLHQKLAMLNCCISRQIQRNKDAHATIHPVMRRRKNTTQEDMGESTKLTNTSQKPGRFYAGRASQLQSLLHGFSKKPRPRSSDVVPMAKRLIETVKNRAAQPQQGASPDSTSSSTSENSAQSPFDTELFSPTSAVPIPKGRPSHRRSNDLQLSVEAILDCDEDGGEDIFYDPVETSEIINDPLDTARRAHSMSESFVALKYSSSVDSQSGVLIDDFDQSTSVNVSGPDPREVRDSSKGEGSLMPFKNLKLLETDAPLMVPKLQEPGYMTEDMIKQQEELFETLGSSSDGAKMRAKIQSAQLISDMEAFKAANPGCILGDFIRWHSPKDWDEDKGEMSVRMADAGNYWQELLPTIFLIVYDSLSSEPIVSQIRQVARGLSDLGQCLVKFPWNELSTNVKGEANLNIIIEKIRILELLIGRSIALVRKFPGQYDLIERILDVNEAVVEDGPEREIVCDLFSRGGASHSFPQPTSREFVLEIFDPASLSKVVTESDGLNSRPLQRRMYACLKESELRIVEAVAKDGLYM
ncbi:Rab3 GTPase-activating protein catalytic subunit [Entomortierella beljakovae]|nr:Rab3 GTPase-activating protein catalytic subunit [Entomortierella beljakovae]